VVLDEADEMLNMGFTESINAILAEVPETRTTLLFSATMPDEIARISKKYMRNPIEITIGSRNTSSENVTHVCYTVHARDKYLALKRIADYNPNIYGIVFCRTRKETQEVADKLIQDGYNADSLHGDLSQTQRDYVMQRFRIRNLQLLVATDVAARGLDVDDLTHVINYSLPDEAEIYNHRSGRTGRAGKTGISVVISNMKEKHLLRQIEKKINRKFEMVNVPTGREICERQLLHMVDKIENVEMADNKIDSFLPAVFEKFAQVSKEEIIKRVLSLEFDRFLDYYKNTPDLAVQTESAERGERGSNSRRGERDRDRGGRDSRGASAMSDDFTRLQINAGKEEGMYPRVLIDLINQHTRGKKVTIGRIDLSRNNTYFEVERSSAGSVIQALNNSQFQGGDLVVEPAAEGGNSERRSSSYGRSSERGRAYSSRSKSYGDSSSRSYSDRSSRSSDRSNGDRSRRSYR
jgi:ATP-dependent RNA helicase DeaD